MADSYQSHPTAATQALVRATLSPLVPDPQTHREINEQLLIEVRRLREALDRRERDELLREYGRLTRQWALAKEGDNG